MALWQWLVVLVAVTLIAQLALVGVLVLAGRRSDARGLAGFIPDCVVLFRRLLADARVAWWRKALLAGLLAYLVSPIDLVPDFIPVLGYADDAILVILVLRSVVRRAGPQAIRHHWPGGPDGLAAVWRLCGLPSSPADT